MEPSSLTHLASLLGIAAVGLLAFYGAQRRWRWLVDPPIWMAFFYSQSLFKLVAGTDGCRVITSALGLLIAAVSLLFLVFALFTP